MKKQTNFKICDYFCENSIEVKLRDGESVRYCKVLMKKLFDPDEFRKGKTIERCDSYI